MDDKNKRVHIGGGVCDNIVGVTCPVCGGAKMNKDFPCWQCGGRGKVGGEFRDKRRGAVRPDDALDQGK